MSDIGLDITSVGTPEPGRRRRRRSRLPGCLAAVLALALLAGGFYYVVTNGVDALRDRLSSSAADYEGPGGDAVIVEVRPGDSTAAIGRTLREHDVVASVQAFIDAAAGNEAARSIQPGYYEVQQQMAAVDALAILVDRTNMLTSTITIPEGFRVDQILDRLAAQTDYRRGQFERVLEDPARLGLPESAGGNPEGYLFPATYTFGPDDRPVDMLTAMVTKFNEVAGSVPLSDASRVGLSEHELLTVASIVEKEVFRDQDLPNVAEVVYNRLNGACSETGGRLEMDSTVHFIQGGSAGGVTTSADARNSDSPYNTYRVSGLPPGPIASPGERALQAALNPTSEGFCFFVAIDLDTGETAFAASYAEHLRNVEQWRTWCRQNAGRC
ncbi:endolytic transglycosylase MltG [Nocardioides limicola]|uniref:endolytic transglycosylase MltG n=1 Tax=Nocardioides limicola TaxID=2803368 RepID=UPI00193BD5DA|nr:endolytic transglycosylase MltG [Nocardioides sp. DJM-14]